MCVKYNPANIGDILKHSWLIEVVNQLSEMDSHRIFLYADTFCGFRDYPVQPLFIERLQKDYANTPLYKIQEPYLRNGRYLSSVSIVKKLLGGRYRADVFDRNIDAMFSHQDGCTRLLEQRSGYDILDSMISYDLILLDPYDDFLDEYKKVLKAISWKIMQSSVLLFVPYLQGGQFQDVKDQAKLLDLDFTAGSAKSRDAEHDGKYCYGMMFFPGTTIEHQRRMDINSELKAKTKIISKF